MAKYIHLLQYDKNYLQDKAVVTHTGSVGEGMGR